MYILTKKLEFFWLPKCITLPCFHRSHQGNSEANYHQYWSIINSYSNQYFTCTGTLL